jgi:hypothetical protein
MVPAIIEKRFAASTYRISEKQQQIFDFQKTSSLTEHQHMRNRLKNMTDSATGKEFFIWHRDRLLEEGSAEAFLRSRPCR